MIGSTGLQEPRSHRQRTRRLQGAEGAAASDPSGDAADILLLPADEGVAMRSEQEAARAIELYADTVRRICMLHLKSNSDTEDIFQTVFLKYVLYSGAYENEEHEKAWLIRVTLNACKDFMKSFFRSHTVPLDEIEDLIADVPEDHSDVLEAVLSLPAKYKTVIYLYFYEQYSAVEIGRLLGKNVNTVYTLLARAKAMLKEQLGGEEFE